MDLQLTGKSALVSGSTAGIGFAIATALAREGARVIVNGRTQAAVDEVRAATGAQVHHDLGGFHWPWRPPLAEQVKVGEAAPDFGGWHGEKAGQFKVQGGVKLHRHHP